MSDKLNIYTPGTKTYVIPANDPMVPGRKLRDELLLAGHKIIREDEAYILVEAPPKPHSFIRLIGSIAWRLLVVMVVVGVTVVVLAGGRV